MVHDVALSPDGKLVASSSMRVWETATGTLIQEINTQFVHTKVEFSSDGKHLISLSLEPAVRVWDLATGILIKEMKGKPGTWSSYVRFPARFSITDNRSIQKTCHGGDQSISSLAVSSNGKLIAFSVQGRIQIRNPLSGALYKEILCPYKWSYYRGVPVVEFSPDGAILVASKRGRPPLFWSCETWELLSITEDPDGTSIFPPNGDILIAKSDWQHVSIVRYDTKSGNIIECAKFMRHWDDEMGNFRCSDDGTLIAVIADRRSDCHQPGLSNYNVWNIGTGKLLVKLNVHNRKPYEVKFSTDNTKIVSASYDGTIRLWDLEPDFLFDEGSSFDEESYKVQRIVRGSSNQTQFTIIESQSASWDLKIGLNQALLVCRDHSSAAVFSPDRSIFICRASSPAGNHYHWQVVNTVTEDIIHQVPSFDNHEPMLMDISANNSVLATVFQDDSKPAWTSAESDPYNLGFSEVNYRCLINFFTFPTGQQKAFRSLAPSNLKLSPDGRLVALAFVERHLPHFPHTVTVLEIRDVTTWNLVKSQNEISGVHDTMTWSSGGHIIVIAGSYHSDGYDGIQLWDLTSDRIVPLSETGHARAIVFSPDDRYCVIDLNEGLIQMHDLTSMTKSERPGLPSKLFEVDPRRHFERFQDDWYLVKFDWCFSEDGKVIETDLGRIDLQSLTGKVEPWPNSSLFFDGDWVVRGVEKVLRLPAAEDINCVTTIGDMLLVVYMSKRLELLDFRARE
ncbi:WD40 repeat-like protein [Penicillium herquei]|nr:WD40 repeat-like protein [Penicillium herquei]